MALTPEQITAQNFKDFYELIRPFLNQATPIIEGAEFGKSDVYSTVATVVGKWIDGRPVYQIVKTFTTPSTANTWTRVINMASSTGFVDVKIYITLENGIEVVLPYNNSALYLLNSRLGPDSYSAGGISMSVSDNAFLSRSGRAVIQFYKTSDPVVLMGADLGAGGGTGDYTDLTNKPSINSITLEGNKTSEDLNLMSLDGVEANPQDNATDQLKKIKINGTVYSLPSGGGGGIVRGSIQNKKSDIVSNTNLDFSPVFYGDLNEIPPEPEPEEET